MEIILSIIAGLIGGGGVGGALKKISMGKTGNLLTGGLGGLLGGLGSLGDLSSIIPQMTGDPAGDAAVAGAAGGGILTTIIGIVKTKFLNKSNPT